MFDALGYYIFYGFNWVITLLPLPVLYIFSDILYLGLYYFPSYRKKVVETNLRNAFPEKSYKELKAIEKRFYHHLADIFIEVLKVTHLSKATQMKRFTFTNMELLDRLKEENRDVVALSGHYNNWEWPSMIQHYMKHKVIMIYKPLQNKYFDDFMKKNRLKYGLILTPTSQVIREIINFRTKHINTLSIFIADQIPSINDIKYWTTFLNQDTALFTGAGKIALKYDMAVVYFNIQKIKRGYYNLKVELLYEHTEGLTEEQIAETFARRLENIIREHPEYWLWSHRRWKHKKPVENV